ncbi:MAG: histidine phosphatase family protein [Acidobacteriota bacterium]|nr:histidine phosphatase family protein [Acidobacteriota bacterium]
MKTIFLLRHAKSSWENSDLSDFDRPLNQRGLETAPFMGEIIFKNQFQIDLIVSSPATRARQTAILVKEAAKINGEIEYDDGIYEASPPRLVKVLSEIAEKYQSAMLVGHNPGMEGLVKFLAGEIQPMPTAALAVIDLKIDKWNEINADCGTLRTLLRPRK